MIFWEDPEECSVQRYVFPTPEARPFCIHWVPLNHAALQAGQGDGTVPRPKHCSFSSHKGVSSHTDAGQHSAEPTLRPWEDLGPLSVQLSALSCLSCELCLLWSPQTPIFTSSTPRVCQAPPGFSLPELGPGKPFKAAKWSNCRTFLICFSPVRQSSLPNVLALKTAFVYLYVFVGCFFSMMMLFQARDYIWTCYSILARAELSSRSF